MKIDTPLEEVAQHLPRNAAGMLVDEHPAVQQVVMEAIRQSIYEWELMGVDLNPVQFDVVVTTTVRDLIGAYREALQISMEKDHE